MVSQTVLSGTLPLGMTVPSEKSPLPHAQGLGWTVEEMVVLFADFLFSINSLVVTASTSCLLLSLLTGMVLSAPG